MKDIKLTLTTEGSIPSTTAISEQFVNGHWRVSARDTYTLHYDTPEPKKTRTVKPLSKRLKKLGIKV